MKTAVKIGRAVVGITGGLQILVGIVFWTGHALSLIPAHMIIGVLFTLGVWLICVLGLKARLYGRSILTFAWSLLVPALGFPQMQIHPGPGHWVVQVVHVLIGVVAMGLAQTLGRKISQVGTPELSPGVSIPAARPTH